MTEHFLSLLHIEKLGHPLEEIRIRALSSVISKYNLNLVDENNVENTKILLDKLFDWFTFEEYSEEKKIFHLLHKIAISESGKMVISEMGMSQFFKRLGDLDRKTGQKHSDLLNDIKACLSTNQENGFQVHTNSNDINGIGNKLTSLNLKNVNKAISNPQGNSIEKEVLDFRYKTYQNEVAQIPQLISTTCDKLIANESDLKTLETAAKSVHTVNSGIFKIEFFPWQNLVPNDKQVLTSVFDGLKYIDDRSSIAQSCLFFDEVVLRDFSPEIFLQRPFILRTFLQLINSVSADLKVPILKCLIRMLQCIQNKVELTLNPAVFNTEKKFHTTSVYPDDDADGDDEYGGGSEKKLSESFYHNFSKSIDNEIFCNEITSDGHKLKRYQCSLPDFCFEVLSNVLPQLKKPDSGREELNCLMELSWECLACLRLNLKADIWQCANGLKDKLYKILAMVQEVVKIHRRKNPVIYIILLNFVTSALNLLKPPSDLDLCDVTPKGLQLELVNCLFDRSLYLMFPKLHSEIVGYGKRFVGQRERELYRDFEDVQAILNSMKSCVVFIKGRNAFKNKMEKLEHAKKALRSLSFHENYQFVRFFVSGCMLKWSRAHLTESESKIGEEILLKLLSNGSANVRTFVYSEINDAVVRLLGEEEAARPNYEFPGDKMEFLFSVDVLTEIICHGLTSDLNKVSEFSNNILVHLLRSKFLMSESCWTGFIGALSPCLGFLECFAEKSTLLGRCVIKMFDPDVARTTALPEIELIKGNIRLLFAKNGLTREEAVSRLFWLLNREDAGERKLPRMAVLTKLNLSSICVSSKAEDYSTVAKSFYDPGKVCDVLEMLATQNLESNVRKSALSQLGLMMEDVLLHSTFLEQKGLQIMLGILDNSLVESDYRHYPDSVIPVIDILKQIALHNASVCQELTSQTGVFYNVLRSLFLFSSDDRFRRNAVQLLWLLLYSDCTLRIPSNRCNGRMLSFPDLVATKMVLPFTSATHWKNSKHFEPCMRKTLLGKENASKLIRVCWAVEWTGSLSEVLAMKEAGIEERTRSPGLPDDMKIFYEDVEELRECSLSTSVKRLLCDIQNASTHQAVCHSIYKLHSYLLLFNVEKTSRRDSENDVTNENILTHMVWESTLERFMVSIPTCSNDESLLSLVVQFIGKLLKNFKSERLISWTEKNLTNVHQPLHRTLKCLGKKNSDLKGRELGLSIVQLAQQVIRLKPSVDTVKWFPYLNLISDFLKLDGKGNEFFNVAYVDWLIGLLVRLTRKCSFSHHPDHLRNLIIRIVEIIIAFHCTPDSASSFMGLNIVRNSIFVLNHVLSDLQNNNTEGWEDVWFQALSKVVGHADNVNYCWMMSLWFARDPIVRAGSLQLFVGFSASLKSCQLLRDRLSVPLQLVWTECFKILTNERECCCVREQCGLLLSNLTAHGTKLFTGNTLENMNRIDFYRKMLQIIENYQPDWTYSELVLDEVSNTFKGEVFTMPGLVTAVCVLMQHVFYPDASSACEKIVETGILERLTRVLGEVPYSAVVCDKHAQCVDVLKMYIAVCRVMTNCALTSSTAHSFLVQCHSLFDHLFSMMNYNLYCTTSPTMTTLKNELWTEVLNLLSALMVDDEQENLAFLALNRCISQNGVDNFTSSLYMALTSESLPLRSAAMVFLSNLFHSEVAMRKDVSVADILSRKISEEVIEVSKSHGSKELTVPDNLTLEFGIRVADVLLGLLLLSVDEHVDSGKAGPPAKALGGLFAVHQPAQNFCLKHNLAGFLVLHLKKICMKLSLENSGGLKKLSDKKRIHPLLQNAELLCHLMGNFMHENDAVRADIVKHGLTVVVHKLWPWIAMKPSIQESILKMLCTFTYKFNAGCRSMVLSSNFAVISFKKVPGSMTLINAVVNHVTVEMDSGAQQSQVLRVCLQLLSNCCDVTECRSVIAKGNILQSFLRLQATRKKRAYSDEVLDAWLKFLLVLSSHQEGQLALTKNQDVLDVILKMAISGPKFDSRMDAMAVLRNVCFHQLNRYRMLNWCGFLRLLEDALTSGRRCEIIHAANAVWALCCNSQKDKLVLRSAGFETKLEAAKRHAAASEDPETEDLVNVVLGILRNK